MSKRQTQLSACSMTGYGKAAHAKNNLTIEVEVKTLNNRNLDLNLKLPRDYSEHEMKLRELAQKFFKRGRVDIQIVRTLKAKSNPELKFNDKLFDKLSKLFVKQAKKLKVYEEEFVQEALIEILSRKDVLEVVDGISITASAEKQLIFKLFSQACAKVQAARKVEGTRLVADIRLRAMALSKNAEKIKTISNLTASTVKESLEAKIKNLSAANLDSGRLEQEVALLVLRSDITEEVVRLDSHLKSLVKTVKVIDGKKLDFMLQEILREFNTIGSKSNDLNITNLVVESKSQIERIREQSQNLE